MRLTRGLLRALVLVCLLASLFALRLAGVNGRDFAGFYQVSNVTEQGDAWRLTFKARVFNYSGADISGATIRLTDPFDPRRSYAAFAGISIASNESTVVSSSVTIPGREYRAWQQGTPPHLIVQYADGQGHRRLAPVELSQRPVE